MRSALEPWSAALGALTEPTQVCLGCEGRRRCHVDDFTRTLALSVIARDTTQSGENTLHELSSCSHEHACYLIENLYNIDDEPTMYIAAKMHP